jgi:hypothetical protein
MLAAGCRVIKRKKGFYPQISQIVNPIVFKPTLILKSSSSAEESNTSPPGLLRVGLIEEGRSLASMARSGVMDNLCNLWINTSCRNVALRFRDPKQAGK